MKKRTTDVKLEDKAGAATVKLGYGQIRLLPE